MVAQLELAARLRQQREAQGLAPATVAEHLSVTRNYYSMVEHGRTLPAVAKLARLVEYLGFDDAASVEMAELLEAAKVPGWWQPYVPVLDPTFVRYLGLEAGASAIHSFEGLIFNGLLQSPDYARAVISSAVDFRADWAQKALEVRLRRQERLREALPPRTTFAFSEAVLLQHYGGPEILRSQLRYVVDLAEELGPRLELRVRPFDVTPRGLGAAGTTILLEFESPALMPVAYREAAVSIGLDDQPEMVDRLLLHFDRALEACLDHAQTLDLIRSRLREPRS